MVLPQHLVIEHAQGPQVDQELVAHLEVVEALLQPKLLLLLSEQLLLSVVGGLAVAAVAVAPPLLSLLLPLPLCRSSSLLRCRLEPRRLLLDQRPQEGGLVLRLAQERGGLALGQRRSSSDPEALFRRKKRANGPPPPLLFGRRPTSSPAPPTSPCFCKVLNEGRARGTERRKTVET